MNPIGLEKSQVIADVLDHGTGALQDVFIRESSYLESHGLQNLIPLQVFGLPIGMALSIQFNDELFWKTNEIHDEAADGMLPPEARTELPVPKPFPEKGFGGSGFVPHPTCLRP